MARLFRSLLLGVMCLLLPLPLQARTVKGGFEAFGYLHAGFGWQRLNHAPVTEMARDGSFAGVLGSVLPNVTSKAPPLPGQDTLMGFVELMELDMVKRFGSRARLRADLLFGRLSSGSFVPGVDVEQAFLAVSLFDEHQLEFQIGRFETEAGFEDAEPYENDTISWSILSRALLYPSFLTGAQFIWIPLEHLKVFVALGNSLTDDTNVRVNDIPAGLLSLQLSWGKDAERENILVISPFIGQESDGSDAVTFGGDATLTVWLSRVFELGLEGTVRRDGDVGGGATTFAAGLINMRVDVRPDLYGALRYAYARQFGEGNGFSNLTGADQQIHEITMAIGYQVSDGMKLKWEGRWDFIDPKQGQMQSVPGMALSLACAF